MKFYLIKQENYEPEAEKGKKFFYTPITETDDWSRSREIMIYDEVNKNCWYSFIFEPDVKLKKIKKSNIDEQLEEFVSDDIYRECFAEVSKEIFFEVLYAMEKRNKLTPLIKKIKKITEEYEM